MISRVKESLRESRIIALVTPDAKHNEILISLLCGIEKDYDEILYISFNNTCKSLSDTLKQQKIDENKFYFIEAVTTSPQALEEVQSEIFDVIDKNKIKLVLMDSSSCLLEQYERIDVLKFMDAVTSKITALDCKGVFSFRKETGYSLRKSIEMFTDKTIDLSEVTNYSNSNSEINFISFISKIQCMVFLKIKTLRIINQLKSSKKQGYKSYLS